jgi:hydrogenase maturation protease
VSVHVVCFGNAWHGDDGFGQHVLRRLPPGIRAFDAGTAGLNALGYFEGCEKAVIVDAVRTGAPVGTVHRLRPRELDASDHFSLHEFGVGTVLAAVPEPPDIVIVGAEVGQVQPFTDRLSAPVEAAVPQAVELVLRECGRPL